MDLIIPCREFYGCSKWNPSGAGNCKFFKWVEGTTVAGSPHFAVPSGAITTPTPNARRAPATNAPGSYAYTNQGGGRSALPQHYHQPGNQGVPASPHLAPRALRFEDEPRPSPPLAVTLNLIDEATFGAKFHYNEELKDFIKQLPPPMRSRWDPTRKMWTFSLSVYHLVVQALEEEAPVPIKLQGIPIETLVTVLGGGHHSTDNTQSTQGTQGDDAGPSQPSNRAPPLEVESRIRRLGSGVWGRLYGFQRDGVRFGLERNGRCLLADDVSSDKQN